MTEGTSHVDVQTPGGEIDTDSARALLAAVIWRACQDATGRGCRLGEAEAARVWLAGDGALWADDLDLDVDQVRRWAACPGDLPARPGQRAARLKL